MNLRRAALALFFVAPFCGAQSDSHLSPIPAKKDGFTKSEDEKFRDYQISETTENLVGMKIYLKNMQNEPQVDSWAQPWGNAKTQKYYSAEVGLPIAVESLKGKNILSLGEGFSGLVEELNKRGVNAYGLDICEEYKSAEQLDSHYIHGDALKFSCRLKDRHVAGKNPCSYDLIVAGYLFCPCCLGSDNMSKSLDESAAVLKPGGEIRYMVQFRKIHSTIKEKAPEYIKQLDDFVERQAKEGRTWRYNLFSAANGTVMTMMLKDVTSLKDPNLFTGP